MAELLSRQKQVLDFHVIYISAKRNQINGSLTLITQIENCQVAQTKIYRDYIGRQTAGIKVPALTFTVELSLIASEFVDMRQLNIFWLLSDSLLFPNG